MNMEGSMVGFAVAHFTPERADALADLIEANVDPPLPILNDSLAAHPCLKRLDAVLEELATIAPNRHRLVVQVYGRRRWRSEPLNPEVVAAARSTLKWVSDRQSKADGPP
jgi:hypothetical protein